MLSFVKLVLFALAAQFMSAAAFVSNNGSHHASRSVQLQHSIIGAASSSSPSTTKLNMATAAPAPVKRKEKKVTNESDNQSEGEKDRGWLVRLYNDPMNKREFVAMCLTQICGLDDGASFSVMMKAHQSGIAVIGNYPREMAEMYYGRLTNEGLFVDMVPADDEE